MATLISSEGSIAPGDCTNWSTAVTVPSGCVLVVAVIGLGMGHAGDETISNVQLGGTAMTKRQGTATWKTEIWTLNGPTVGGQNFTGSKSSTEYTYFRLYYFSSGEYVGGGTDVRTSTSTSVTIDGRPGDYVIEGLFGHSNGLSYSAGSGQTEDNEWDIFASKFMCYYLALTATTTTVTLNSSGSIGLGHTAAVIRSPAGFVAFF